MRNTVVLSFKTLTESDAAMAARWFQGDPEGQREFGGFYGHHPRWWDLVDAGDKRHGWTIWEGTTPVGFVDLDLNDGIGDVAIYVVSDHRGRGVGRATLKALALLARDKGAKRLRGAVATDNVASLRVALAAGGQAAVLTGDDEIVVLGPLLSK